MGSLSIDSVALATAPRRALRLPAAGVLQGLALALVVALAAGLRLANLGALGYANRYYTAGVASMLQSWHNFFFVAAEPGGAVSIDKPPVGLWLQAISAYFLGVNGLAMVLPEIVCGLLSVVVLYHLVRRSYGPAAGLLAALALAIAPIAVATDRNNTMDSSLILMLLFAAWAFIRATESGRLRHLLLGAALVGIGFNIKMLQAYLPLPAFYGLYFLGARVPLRRTLAQLALASGLLLTVSLSWAVIVDLTPADRRPYVGSSQDNSVLSLALGYNGLQRLTGMGGNISSFLARLTGGDNGPTGAVPRPDGNANPRPFGQGPGDGRNLPPQGPDGNGNFRNPGPGFVRGRGGFPGTGQPGLLRLFVAPLSKEVSWLLPFGLFGLLLLAFRNRLCWPVGPTHQTAVLWGGWLLIGGVFFSVAGFFHEYYLAMLAPALAALVGIGAVEVWHLREAHPWRATAWLLISAATTLGLQYATANSYVGLVGWMAVPLILFGLGAVLLGRSVYDLGRRRRLTSLAGTASLVGAMLFVPGVWSGLTALNVGENQSLPSAYGGPTSTPSNAGDLRLNQSLLDFLQANTRDVAYLMAVPSAMQGADYVIATGRPVLYMGGFMGQDPVVTAGDLTRMVAGGELRYVYWEGGDGGRGFRNRTDISAWVTAQCTPVEGFDALTRNAGTPDGTGGPNGNTGPGFGAIRVILYDCAP